jgi:prevent-host-death family protein
MQTIDAHDAQEQLPWLLEEVAKGETISITQRGRTVAVLTPPARPRRAMGDATVQLRTLRRGMPEDDE